MRPCVLSLWRKGPKAGVASKWGGIYFMLCGVQCNQVFRCWLNAWAGGLFCSVFKVGKKEVSVTSAIAITGGKEAPTKAWGRICVWLARARLQLWLFLCRTIWSSQSEGVSGFPVPPSTCLMLTWPCEVSLQIWKWKRKGKKNQTIFYPNCSI